MTPPVRCISISGWGWGILLMNICVFGDFLCNCGSEFRGLTCCDTAYSSPVLVYLNVCGEDVIVGRIFVISCSHGLHTNSHFSALARLVLFSPQPSPRLITQPVHYKRTNKSLPDSLEMLPALKSLSFCAMNVARLPQTWRRDNRVFDWAFKRAGSSSGVITCWICLEGQSHDPDPW